MYNGPVKTEMLNTVRRLPGRAGAVARRRTGALVVDGFFHGMSRLGKLHPNARPHRHGVQVIKDIPYRAGGSRDHLLDVYRPEGAPPSPAVLYVHGGGFRILSKDSHWVMGLALARRGLTVFNVNYRLAPRHRYPAAHEDICAALVWLMEHAKEFGGDTSNLVLTGESAGANLVAALAVACCFPRPEPWARQVWDLGVVPRAVLPICGMLQLTKPERLWQRRPMSVWLRDRLEEPALAYLGAADAPCPAGLADPLLILEGDEEAARTLPPFFAAVGTKDPLLDDTRRLDAALSRRGVLCEARYYPGEVHAFHALAWRANARRCWMDTYAFLQDRAGIPLQPARGKANKSLER